MNTRILKLRKYLALTQEEFSQAIDIKRSTLSGIEIGRAPITNRLISLICSKFSVNENWLRTGKGEMFVKIDKKFNEFFTIYNNLAEPLQQYLLTSAKEHLNTQKQLNL